MTYPIITDTEVIEVLEELIALYESQVLSEYEGTSLCWAMLAQAELAHRAVKALQSQIGLHKDGLA